MLVGRFLIRVALGTALCLSIATPLFAADVRDAAEKLKLYREELKKVGEAQARNDPNAAEQSHIAAEELLHDARKAYEAAQVMQGKDAMILRDYAEVLQAQHDPDLAVKALTRATRLDPHNSALWVALGQALIETGHSRAKEAQQTLRHALQLDDKSPAAANAHAVLGKLYWKEGLYDLAQDHYTKAAALDAANITAQIGVIALQIRNGKIREASTSLDSMGILPPETFPLLEESMQQFDARQESFTDDGPGNIAYARLLLRIGRIPESLAAAERASRLNPEDYMTWNLLGDLCQGTNNPARAIEAYTRSLQIKADQPRTQERLNTLNNALNQQRQQNPPSMLLQQ